MFQNVAAQDQVELFVGERQCSEVGLDFGPSWLNVDRRIAPDSLSQPIRNHRLRRYMQDALEQAVARSCGSGGARETDDEAGIHNLDTAHAIRATASRPRGPARTN
jgi:hypothetical protein